MTRHLKKIIKKIFRPLADFCRKITFKLMRDVIKKLEDSIQKNSAVGTQRIIPFESGELIRIMFLFQVASFWPNWESFYQACLDDPRFSVKFTFLDELYGDTTQMLSAKKFLEEQGMEYEIYSDKLFSRFNPHILVMQTPYDFGHRKLHVRSASFKKKGTRIVYIPYGIELADTEHARDAHFYNAVVRNAWRVFTFSERMREDYRQMCPNYPAVKCVGHPKFDSLYHRELYPQLETITKAAKGRPVLVWHVHFPKLVPQPDGTERMSTPDLKIYIEFAKYITRQTDLFVVLQPHPKFLDGEGDLGIRAKKIVAIIEDAENGYVDWSDDYRNTLVNCDYFISDRSALMVEAVCTGVPILYMHNKEYDEPLTPAIQPIIGTYYQGTGFEEMKEFVVQCQQGEDPLREKRIQAFRENIPYFDGKCGERIKDHIADALEKENENPLMERLDQLQYEIDNLGKKVEMLIETYKGEDNRTVQ